MAELPVADVKVVVYKDVVRRFRFRVKSRWNGQNIGPASQGYSRSIDMWATIRTLLGATVDERTGALWRIRPDAIPETIPVEDRTGGSRG